MSFKEALTSFINGYEEPTEAVEAEQPTEAEEADAEEVEADKVEIPEPEASSVEETTEEEKKATDPIVASEPVPAGMADIIFDKALSDEAKASLTDEEKEKLYSLDAQNFLATIEVLKDTFPVKPSGKITKAMKPSKSDPEEDWTLALFQD